jgi:Caspase domain
LWFQQTLTIPSSSISSIERDYFNFKKTGHGARVRDDDRGEEDDGYDETLVPVDYDSAGQIRDDDLYQNLVCALPSGTHLVALMDCCHSGSVLDLPYKYKAGGSSFGSTGGGGTQMLMQTSTGGKMCLCVMCCCCIGVILAIVLPLVLLL